MKNKLVIPIGDFYPYQGGGPSNSMYWLAQELARNDTDVMVITVYRYPIKSLKCDTVLDIDGFSVYYASSKKRLLKRVILEIRKGHILHLNSLFYWLSIFSFVVSRFSDIDRVVWSVRGELHPAALSYNSTLKYIWLLVFRNFTDGIKFHVTNDIEEDYTIKSLGQVDTCIIPNLKKAYDLESAQKGETINFLFLGRIHPIKNIEFLISVFESCNFTVPVKLYIVGTGEEDYVNKLKGTVQSTNIIFTGALHGDAKLNLLASSEILLLPSFSENFGNVVVEALELGVVPVVSDKTPWQGLKVEQCGYWLQLNTNVWVDTLVTHINDLGIDERNDFSIRAREYFKKSFNIESRIGEWTRAYGHK